MNFRLFNKINNNTNCDQQIVCLSVNNKSTWMTSALSRKLFPSLTISSKETKIVHLKGRWMNNTTIRIIDDLVNLGTTKITREELPDMNKLLVICRAKAREGIIYLNEDIPEDETGTRVEIATEVMKYGNEINTCTQTRPTEKASTYQRIELTDTIIRSTSTGLEELGEPNLIQKIEMEKKMRNQFAKTGNLDKENLTMAMRATEASQLRAFRYIALQLMKEEVREAIQKTEKMKLREKQRMLTLIPLMEHSTIYFNTIAEVDIIVKITSQLSQNKCLICGCRMTKQKLRIHIIEEHMVKATQRTKKTTEKDP